MTTATKQETRAWDFLLGEDVPARPSIEMWRKTNWTHIKHELRNEYGTEVLDSREPHWVAPGTAVFYQNTVNRRRHLDNDGHYGPMVETESGWEPTNPLPAGNASQIHNYLQNGFRLRPLEYDVDVEVSETAGPAEGSGEPQLTLYCKRHSERRFRFSKWSVYLAHCNHFKEAIEEKPPDFIIGKMGQYKWYCLRHDVGFQRERMVRHHMNHFSDKRRGLRHATLAQMEVKQG